jgi:redox-sensitive bicupin YhaK (pirin superfamily)
MITLRKSHERGHAQHGWLDSRHTFSFAGYHDPEHMGFRDLRVINEDRVEPARGFGTHAHRDMEIVSYVLAGELAHRDSLGTGSVIRPGDVQRMSAGTGVTHSELNPSPRESVHFLQIWILPEKDGLPPSYEQRHFPAEERKGRLRLVASRDARDGSLRVHQDVDVYASLLGRGDAVTHALRPGRHAWLQLARGRCTLNGVALEAGDGAAVSGEPELRIDGAEGAELLLFDLA